MVFVADGIKVATVGCVVEVFVDVDTAVGCVVEVADGTNVAGDTWADVEVDVDVAVCVDVTEGFWAILALVSVIFGVRVGSSTVETLAELDSDSTIANMRANAKTPTTAIATITSLPMSRRI